MKTKELVQLIVAVLIFIIAGYIIYSVLVPQKSSGSNKGVSYTKVTPVNPNFSQTDLSNLGDSTKVRDFYNPPDLNNGLNNSQPFGPLQ